MKCIVGLGNPGLKYRKTRHNIGFMIIDELANRFQAKLKDKKFNGHYSIVNIKGERVLLLKPQTFMNLSGECIRPLIDYYKIDLDDILVIYDDLDLPTGKIRLRKRGGHGGHNGVRSTIDHLGTEKFKRLRFGIGRPTTAKPIVDYVLEKFSKKDLEEVNVGIQLAADACEAWLTKPFDEVMNEYN